MPSVDSGMLISRWHRRQREILSALPPQLFAEYRQLEILIESVRSTEARIEAEHVKGVKDLAEAIASPKPDEIDRAACDKLYAEDNSQIPDLISASELITFGSSRVPLSIHRKRLIDFLAEKGPSMRAEIAMATHIPNGSLSEVLRGPEFEQVERGLWRLRGKVPKSR
jgi:hypothetical protein